MKRILLALAALPFFAFAQVDYTVQPAIPAETVRVAIHVDAPGAHPEFRLPAWCPGWYVLTSTQKEVSGVRATDPTGAQLKVTLKDPHGWVVDNPSEGAVVFSYRVLADEEALGFDRVYVDKITAFINGPAAFMYLEGRITDPVTVKLKLPEKWDVATAMEPAAEGTYSATDYDELIDSPIQMGVFDRRTFTVNDIPFEAVFVVKSPPASQDLDYETNRLKQLCAPAMRMFGTQSFKHYTFFIHIASNGNESGLEHRAGSVLSVQNSKPLAIDELATHEFFHAWNVKQIRPKVLGPFDYTQPCRTHTLWFLEGVTDYYSNIDVYRSGLGDERRLLSILSAQISTLQRSPTRLQFSLEDICYNTWEHGGFGYGDLSYYTKGLVVGLIFDAAIRQATQGAKSLDDVMRALYDKYKSPKPGYEENGILAAINDVSGRDMTALYHQMLQSTEEVPYELLQGIGLRVHGPGFQLADTALDLNGGVVASVNDAQQSQGLQVGDQITAIRRTDQRNTFEVDVTRNGTQLTLTLPVYWTSVSSFRLERDPFATGDQQQRLAEWLKR
jgi:predicted metalloprotease with PDZ domain